MVDSVLAAAGLAEQPSDLAALLLAIASDCVAANGVPDTNGRLTGAKVSAKVMRDEARRRIADRGLDTGWLEKAVARVQGQTRGDLTGTSEALYVLMREEPPQGLSINVESGHEDDRLIGLLVHAYVSGTLQLAQLRAQGAR